MMYCSKCKKFLMHKANVGTEKIPMCKGCYDKFLKRDPKKKITIEGGIE